MATEAGISGRTSTIRALRQRLSDAYRRTMSPAEGGSADCIELGDFCIDMESRSAAVRGYQLHLTHAEFDVLLYLTSHRKQVVTTHTSLATKAANSGVCQTEFLPALLSLRKKLQEAVPGAHYIRTEFWTLYDFQPGT